MMGHLARDCQKIRKRLSENSWTNVKVNVDKVVEGTFAGFLNESPQVPTCKE